MFVAWLGAIIFCAMQLAMMRYGAGVNVWDVPEDDLKIFNKVWRPECISNCCIRTDPPSAS